MLGLGGKGDIAMIGPIRRGNSKTHAYRVPISYKAVGIPVRSNKSVTFTQEIPQIMINLFARELISMG